MGIFQNINLIFEQFRNHPMCFLRAPFIDEAFHIIF